MNAYTRRGFLELVCTAAAGIVLSPLEIQAQEREIDPDQAWENYVTLQRYLNGEDWQYEVSFLGRHTDDFISYLGTHRSANEIIGYLDVFSAYGINIRDDQHSQTIADIIRSEEKPAEEIRADLEILRNITKENGEHFFTDADILNHISRGYDAQQTERIIATEIGRICYTDESNRVLNDYIVCGRIDDYRELVRFYSADAGQD